MAYEVVVLRPGYCIPHSSGGDGFDVACTITLLKGKHTILVDTGSAWESELLQNVLAQQGLNPDKIDYVVVTHGHSDRIGNLNLFTNATHIVCHDIHKGNDCHQHPFNQDVPYAIDPDVSVESTPGHTSQDITVYVHTNSEQLGVVAICGDVFENEKDLADPELWQNQSQFPELQQQSRMKILQKADTIIPGHGPMFKPPESLKEDLHMIMITSIGPDSQEAESPLSD